jgi:hypothetical protein
MIRLTAFSCLNSIKQPYLLCCDNQQLFLESAQYRQIPAYLFAVRGIMPAVLKISAFLRGVEK